MNIANLSIKKKAILLMGLISGLIPILLVGIMTYSYYLFGVENFFDAKVSAAIEQTVQVAELYLQEHINNIKIDTFAIANKISRDKDKVFNENPKLIQYYLDEISAVKGMPEIMVFFRDGKVLGRNSRGLSLWFVKVQPELLDLLDSQDIVIIEDEQNNKVRAVTRIESFVNDIYILVGRYIDPKILEYMKKTKDSSAEYSTMLGGLHLSRAKLGVVFGVCATILLALSMLVGKRFAKYITTPLENISNATIALRQGNFEIKVPESQHEDEISSLSKAFNVMINTISQQQSKLLTLNQINQDKMQLIEMILEQVSTGILVFDLENKLLLHNDTAIDILNFKKISSRKALYAKYIMPEIAEILNVTKTSQRSFYEKNFILTRGKKTLHLFLKVTPIINVHHQLESLLVTFSDITEVITNQKMLAWTDIARRVAHEIKNPLTPISLAAERLRKKYQAEIKTDRESFIQYIDTIIVHVDDIQRMITEFINYARIPSPRIAQHDLLNVIKESMLLQKISHPTINFEVRSEYDSAILVLVDHGQILRVLNNLLANSADAIEHGMNNLPASQDGMICVQVLVDHPQNQVMVSVIDNGGGIDAKILDTILEPYVSTKKHGTGIGLAIVQKIIEEHGGHFAIHNVKDGVEASFNLPLVRS